MIIIIPTNRFKLSYILYNIKTISNEPRVLYSYLTFKVKCLRQFHYYNVY